MKPLPLLSCCDEFKTEFEAASKDWQDSVVKGRNVVLVKKGNGGAKDKSKCEGGMWRVCRSCDSVPSKSSWLGIATSSYLQ